MATTPGGVAQLGMAYVAGVQMQTLCGSQARATGPPPKKGRDAPNTISVKELALSLKAKAWLTIK
jgi:hypothetical protein